MKAEGREKGEGETEEQEKVRIRPEPSHSGSQNQNQNQCQRAEWDDFINLSIDPALRLARQANRIKQNNSRRRFNSTTVVARPAGIVGDENDSQTEADEGKRPTAWTEDGVLVRTKCLPGDDGFVAWAGKVNARQNTESDGYWSDKGGTLGRGATTASWQSWVESFVWLSAAAKSPSPTGPRCCSLTTLRKLVESCVPWERGQQLGRTSGWYSSGGGGGGPAVDK
ncbi:hypothetical protein CORC01_11768 [Colletotrichum orchidophilum]|uniref:Uncharacterized protein n=1 Tax=Colletotrichum orchidophilum TaxID=1209926 RepID=A0A1G4AUW2_9PEZI|nr:uncharacterized protein CORC01_11768 [Colletotrichum orchidophilum]OHE92901.1 hypothetical protein CORC01_11768 [Colletotrichum orchidophilum]